jgi:hypothetical protein
MHPRVGLGPAFHHSWFHPVGPVTDTMRRDRSQRHGPHHHRQLTISPRQLGPEPRHRLPRPLQAQLPREHPVTTRRFRHHTTDQVVHQEVALRQEARERRTAYRSKPFFGILRVANPAR